MVVSRSGAGKLAMLAVAGFALAACGKKENSAADTTEASGKMAGDTSAMAASSANTSGNWSDPNIVALLDEANMADSAAGAIAAKKGTSAAIREFGKRMMRDHHNLRAQGQALAKELNVTPQAPADDNSVSDSQKNLDNLNSTAKGKGFDKAYIDHEVDYHKAVLDVATKAMNQAQNTELKNLIQKAAPAIKAHLAMAESIQKKT